MALENSEPKYVISIAAKIVGIETHTLRYYEDWGWYNHTAPEGIYAIIRERYRASTTYKNTDERPWC